jgi:hypothetical protein
LQLKDQGYCYYSSMNEDDRKNLLQIYTIERQDLGSSQITTFAIIAAALTYFVASAGFLIGHYTKSGYKNIPTAVLLGSPLVTAALLSSLVVTVSTNVMRVKHLRKLEDLLGQTVAEDIILPSSIRDFGDIWDIRTPRSWLRVYSALSLATYIPIFLVSLGYIFAVLVPGAWSWYKGLVFSIYCLVAIMQVAGLLVASWHPRFKTDFV